MFQSLGIHQHINVINTKRRRVWPLNLHQLKLLRFLEVKVQGISVYVKCTTFLYS